MGFTISLIILLFIIPIEAFIPYFSKNKIVFGVTVPEQTLNHPLLRAFKRKYSYTILLIGIALTVAYIVWALNFSPSEELLILTGVVLQFIIIITGAILYFYFHRKTNLIKTEEQWGVNLKQVKVTDLSIRSKDEMLPWYLFLIPTVMTVGVFIYTAIQYDLLPEEIPTHWGPSGEPDAFTKKNPFTAISLPLILLMIQMMFLGITELTRQSGFKLSATRTEASVLQQITARKYTSWYMFVLSMMITLLFSFLQLTTIHGQLVSEGVMIALPIVFVVITLVGTIFYAVKVNNLGDAKGNNYSRDITDVDEDQYWKGGLIYFNKNDPSIVVEKRFGVGWTLNFARPLGYIVLFGPIVGIILIVIAL